jgi:outer membrane protein, multidrug efflux system
MARCRLLSASLVASIAAAQGPAPAQQAQTPAPTQQTPPAPPGDGTPPLPEITDTMLEPRPRPNRSLTTWREALKLLRSRASAIRISRAQILQAQGRSRQALAGALPSLMGTASLQRHLLFGTGVNFTPAGVVPDATIPDPAMFFDASVTLRQPILALGAWYAIETAKRQTKAIEVAAQDTERLMLGTVAEGAVNVVTAQRVADISRVSLESALSTLDLTRRRAQLGAASVVDVLRAEQEVALARAQVVSADEAVAQSQEALGMALGDDQPWDVNPNVDLGELARTAAEVCRPLKGVDSRSDLLAARMNIDIAERNVRQVDLRYAPTLDLTSQLSFLGNLNRSPNGEHVTWTIGAVLNWPLYDGGDRAGDRLRAEAESEIAREQYQETKRGANVQVKQASRAVEVAMSRLSVSAKSRDIAAESARLARVAFMSGSGTSFDLVDTARRQREAEIDLAIKEFEVVRAQIASFLAEANCEI